MKAALSALVILLATCAPENASALKVKMLPDVRPHTPTEKEISDLEKARSEAAKVKKNPQ